MKIAIVNLGDSTDDVLHLRFAKNGETINDYSVSGISRGEYVEFDLVEGTADYQIFLQGEKGSDKNPPIGKPQILVTDPSRRG